MEHPVKGTITFPFDGTVDLPEGGGSAPEEYHWFQDGADLSILTKDKKLNDKILSAQAVFRGGVFSGHIRLDKSSPIEGEPIMVFPRGDHFKFIIPGLANAGAAYGSGWYSNKDGFDAQPILVQWLNYGLQFLAPNDGRLSRVKKGFPTTWENYGLFLSWEVQVP